ncbi:hypothetical protein ZWY2020_047235 [Hordeum vulgare]|nr:hypothetical protein ZWY2020_047235 [Hordeum vulgare]
MLPRNFPPCTAPTTYVAPAARELTPRPDVDGAHHGCVVSAPLAATSPPPSARDAGGRLECLPARLNRHTLACPAAAAAV